MPALTPSRSGRPGYGPHSTRSRLALACSGAHSTRPGLLWALHDLPVPAPESPGRGAAALNLKSTRPGLLWAIPALPVPGLADSEARACYSVTSMTRAALRLRHWHSTRDLNSTRRGLALWAFRLGAGRESGTRQCRLQPRQTDAALHRDHLPSG